MNPDRPPPYRLKVLKNLQALLEQISELDGDAFTMAGKVHRNRVIFGVEVNGKPPQLSIVEGPRPDFAVFAGEDNSDRKDQWTLMIQGIVADDRKDSTADDAYFLCQDVERRLARILATKSGTGNPQYPGIYMLDGMITAVEIAPPVVRPPEQGVSSNAFFYLPIRIGIAAKIGE